MVCNTGQEQTCKVQESSPRIAQIIAQWREKLRLNQRTENCVHQNWKRSTLAKRPSNDELGACLHCRENRCFPDATLSPNLALAFLDADVATFSERGAPRVLDL